MKWHQEVASGGGIMGCILKGGGVRRWQYKEVASGGGTRGVFIRAGIRRSLLRSWHQEMVPGGVFSCRTSDAWVKQKTEEACGDEEAAPGGCTCHQEVCTIVISPVMPDGAEDRGSMQG
eukprot:1145352-Pelagomonas_calceolata.AAC.3